MSQRIAVIAGDGIGVEVIAAGRQVLDALSDGQSGLELQYTAFPWGTAYYHEHGRYMPEDGLQQLKDFDAIYFGAVGAPDVPDALSLWQLLIPMRRGFDQYVNLRPTRLLRGVSSPLANPGDIDVVVVRENTEGEYSDVGGRIFSGTEREVAIQESVFTRQGVERVVRYAFELARTRRKRVTGATKSNGIRITMPFFDEVFFAVAKEYADVEAGVMHADALAAQLVLRPTRFDVIVGSNLLGDILSEITAAITGAIGIAPSANLDPERRYPSMFEPIHGSAPDIAGQGIANPIGAIWAAALMLDHLGHPAEAARILSAIEATTAAGDLTPDLGGHATTQQVTDAIIARLSHALV
ncbi:MAG TPA: tartrate dehydrogenase [Ktedonobacterales bacterium]|nr:tartrate dehydrogenase [Ktedonobacterales bacterium]